MEGCMETQSLKDNAFVSDSSIVVAIRMITVATP